MPYPSQPAGGGETRPDSGALRLDNALATTWRRGDRTQRVGSPDLRRLAAGGDVVHAGPRRGSRFQPCFIDRLATCFADPVPSGRSSFEGSVDLRQVLQSLTGHHRQLGALVGDRLTLRVVLVIGVRVAR